MSEVNDEDKSLYEAYDEYLSTYKYKDRIEAESILWSKIQNLSTRNSLRYFLFAKHYYKYDYNIEKVIYYIGEAINRFRENIPLFIEYEGVCIYNPEIEYLRAIKSSIYQMAGEIYAIKGDYNRSLYFYKNYHYLQSFLKSDFEGSQSIKLYSFRSIKEYSLSDLKNKTITVCHPSKMNDPCDSPYLLWSSKYNLTEVCKMNSHIEPYSRSFDYFRIRSFSLCGPKNVLMWSHYADQHKGFCIKYHLSDHFIKEKENAFNRHMYLKRIEYKNKKISIRIPSIDATLGYATKCNLWKYEKEVRLISFNPNIEEEYECISLDEDSNIDAIYFGFRCDDRRIDEIKNICYKRYSNIKFYKMKLNAEDIYKMKQEKI